MEEITFFILRHINNKQSNNLWVNCYKSIREFYNNKIIIIDDNSNKKYISKIKLKNTEIIESEFKGAGEILPYYYFHKLKPSNKMIFLHDSMFLIKKINEDKIKNINDVSYLFYFDDHRWDCNNTILNYLKLLKNNNDLISIFNKKKWFGCFGVSSIITLDFLNKIQNKYNFFNLIKYIKTRENRMDIERIFSILSYSFINKNNYFINKIHSNKGAWLVNINNYKQYINIWKKESPIIKLWSGR